MKEYAHTNTEPRSEYVRFRGETGQIDIKDSVVSILSAKPGSTGTDVADLIFDKLLFPRSYAGVQGVLANLVEDNTIVQNGDFFYLLRDAVQHDMAITVKATSDLLDAGVDMNRITFLSSGVVMAAENAIAESEGRNYDPMYTVAADAVSTFEEDEDDWDDEEEVDEDDIEDVENPFESLTDSDTEELKEEASLKIKAEAAHEAKMEKMARLRTITDATQLLGREVEIIIPGVTQKVVGTILELRPSGCNFLITYSEDTGITEGTVMPLEYSKGFAYKLID
jgi:hypothetical protein